MEKLSVKEFQEETAKLFGLTLEDVSYITEEYLSQDFQEFDSSKHRGQISESILTLPDVFHGHNVAYGRHSNGRFIYTFLSGQYACNTIPNMCYQDEYNHYNLNQYCGSVSPRNHIVQFRKKR